MSSVGVDPNSARVVHDKTLRLGSLTGEVILKGARRIEPNIKVRETG